MSAFDMYAYVAKKELGENAVSWDSQNNLDYQWLLVTRESSTQSPEAIKRLLKALIKAEEFVVNNEDETKDDYRPEMGSQIPSTYVTHGVGPDCLSHSINPSSPLFRPM